MNTKHTQKLATLKELERLENLTQKLFTGLRRIVAGQVVKPHTSLAALQLASWATAQIQQKYKGNLPLHLCNRLLSEINVARDEYGDYDRQLTKQEAQLVAYMTEAQIMRIPDLGRKKLALISQWLRTKHNLELGMSKPTD